jgi:hypothetical protein
MIWRMTKNELEEIKKHQANDLKIAKWACHTIDFDTPDQCDFLGIKYTGEERSRNSYHNNDGDAATLFSVLSDRGYLFTVRSIRFFHVVKKVYIIIYYIMVEDHNANTVTQESAKTTLAEAITTAVLHIIEKEKNENLNNTISK